MPHPAERQRSELNLQCRVENRDQAACFVWYSGNTRANGRGSVMVYRTKDKVTESWFAAFRRQDCWKLHATKGKSLSEVEQLLSAA